MKVKIATLITKQTGALANVIASLKPLGLAYKKHEQADGPQTDQTLLTVIAEGDATKEYKLLAKLKSINGVRHIIEINTVSSAPAEAASEFQLRYLQPHKGDDQDPTMYPVTHTELDRYFATQLQGLQSLLANAQGNESVKNLEKTIADSAVSCEWPLSSIREVADAKVIDIKPEHYSSVLQTAIGYVAEQIGSSIVVKQLRKVNRRFEGAGLEIRDFSRSLERSMRH